MEGPSSNFWPTWKSLFGHSVQKGALQWGLCQLRETGTAKNQFSRIETESSQDFWEEIMTFIGFIPCNFITKFAPCSLLEGISVWAYFGTICEFRLFELNFFCSGAQCWIHIYCEPAWSCDVISGWLSQMWLSLSQEMIPWCLTSESWCWNLIREIATQDLSCLTHTQAMFTETPTGGFPDSVQWRFQDFDQGGPVEFWPQGGPWAQNVLKIGGFPLKIA